MPGADHRLAGLFAVAHDRFVQDDRGIVSATYDVGTNRERHIQFRPAVARVVSVADLMKNGGR